MPNCSDPSDNEARDVVRAHLRALAAVRGRPNVVFHDPEINGPTVAAVTEALDGCGPAVDIVLHSPGGCSCCGYSVARELRRRCSDVGVVVPYVAKSAAAIVALSGDELVLGPLGELGPLDAQSSRKQRSDVSVRSSCLVTLRALNEVKRFGAAAYDELVNQLIDDHRMQGEDACRAAGDVVGKLAAPILGQIDPRVLAENARWLECGAMYAERLLRRYRPEIWARNGRRIVEQLVYGYPTHDFVIDLEELAEIGLPARGASELEFPAVTGLAASMSHLEAERMWVERIDPPTVQEVVDEDESEAGDSEAENSPDNVDSEIAA